MKSKTTKMVGTALGVLVGNLILAFCVAAFVVPHGIIMGGATGIGLIISHYLPVKLSVVVLTTNVVLFVMGALTLGKTFIVTTIASTFLYPALLSVMQSFPQVAHLTDNTVLATLYAGALLGLGIGIIVRVGASTGGTDIIALVLHKYLHISVAGLMYVVEFLVMSAQVFFSNSEQIMYGIIALVLETVLMNRVMLMGQSQIQIFIISDKYEEIRERLLKEQDTGVTMVHVQTGFKQEEQKAALCVIPHRKLYAINEMIHLIDENAFLTISRINEVRGRGFSLERVSYPLAEEAGQTETACEK